MATHEYRVMVLFWNNAIEKEMARVGSKDDAIHIASLWRKNHQGVDAVYIEMRTIGDWEELENKEGGAK